MNVKITKYLCLLLLAVAGMANAQPVPTGNVMKSIQGAEFVIKSKKGFDLQEFIGYVVNDTTFYKAFKNLRVLNYTADNTIELFDKKGKVVASQHAVTRQQYDGSCRTMQMQQEQVTGDFYNRKHQYNYYTAQLYDHIFYTHGKICGENNIIGNELIAPSKASGLEKSKAQLKVLMFNPGRAVPGIPFIGNKTAIFEDKMAYKYNFYISLQTYNGIPCYFFRAIAKPYFKEDVVIDELETWFRQDDYTMVARQYGISYKTWVYDFVVRIKVDLQQKGPWLVPVYMHYTGNWDIPGKPRERGRFETRLSGFKP